MVTTAPIGSGLANLWAKRRDAVGTPEFDHLNAEVSRIDDQFRSRQPHGYLQERLRSLYVDLDEFGRSWNRPGTISQGDAVGAVMASVSDYMAILDQSTMVDAFEEAALIADYLADWAERPTLLPKPEYPR